MERGVERDPDPGRGSDAFTRGATPSTGPPQSPGSAATAAERRSGEVESREVDSSPADPGQADSGPADSNLPDDNFSDDNLSDDNFSDDELSDDDADGASPEAVAFSETAAPKESPSLTDFETFAEVAAISRLKYRYLRTLDMRSWEDFTETMVPEATATYSEYLQFDSRESFVAFLRSTLDSHIITEHRCDHPEIDIAGDTATGTWFLSDTVLIPEHKLLMRGAAYYHDRYVRCDDGKWRISHTGYERTYEVVVSLSDLPSLRLTSDRWGLIARGDEVSSIQRDPGAAPAYRDGTR